MVIHQNHVIFVREVMREYLACCKYVYWYRIGIKFGTWIFKIIKKYFGISI